VRYVSSIETNLTQHDAFSDSQVDELIAELNASVTGLQSLHTWAAQSGLATDRLVESPALTYVRLAARDERGEPIVLMRLEHVWERAL